MTTSTTVHESPAEVWPGMNPETAETLERVSQRLLKPSNLTGVRADVAIAYLAGWNAAVASAAKAVLTPDDPSLPDDDDYGRCHSIHPQDGQRCWHYFGHRDPADPERSPHFYTPADAEDGDPDVTWTDEQAFTRAVAQLPGPGVMAGAIEPVHQITVVAAGDAGWFWACSCGATESELYDSSAAMDTFHQHVDDERARVFTRTPATDVALINAELSAKADEAAGEVAS